jgi:hypothetical protein
MAVLQVLQRLLMMLDGTLELLDVLCTAGLVYCAACALPRWRISYGAWLVLSSTWISLVQVQQSWWALCYGELTGLRPPLRFCC